MREVKIEPGQHWQSKGGERVIKVTRYIQGWDDVRYVNVATGRGGAIYGDNLRRKYTLAPAPESAGRREA